jgi:hypothetical protein
LCVTYSVVLNGIVCSGNTYSGVRVAALLGTAESPVLTSRIPNTRVTTLGTMASINWTMLDDNQNPVPLPGEEQVMTIDNGVEITLLVPSSRSTGGIGGSGDKLKETGKLRLTDKRVSGIPSKF